MKSSFLVAALCAVVHTVLCAAPTNYTAVAVIDNGAGIKGTVTFYQADANSNTTVHAEITGLAQGDHGFHVHSLGDVTQGCNSTGEHYNPFNVTHGSIDSNPRHVGDLGNVVSPGPSQATVFQATNVYLPVTGQYSIVGRAIVLHAGQDDLGLGNSTLSKANGNSGARIACAVIGYAT
ncbi:superoxide dismutase [Hesseltinella vesiculosa]|uniref:Superoxide dismutase [Cu-Zn] n=1 Tax=Hesseltinella vesiculosa TaxID=101127 RepID=A0A1X2G6N5_9FUNG|nr:superoxide dismutase [Hesseltinella vesiculosa]